MKKSAHHLQRHHHSDYNKRMGPDVPKVTANRLPLPLIITAILIILGAVFAYYLMQKKTATQPVSSPPPAKTADTLPPLPERFLTCPLTENLCQSADFYSTHVKDSSFSATLKADTPFLAVFDGEMDVVPTSRPLPGGKNEELTMLAIVNQERKLVAQYYFKGQPPKKRRVLQGEVIASTSGQPLNFLEGKTLVLVVLGMTEKGDSGLEPLKAANFK